eukprot:12907823-Alexandrium_andersonii.AAC.1
MQQCSARGHKHGSCFGPGLAWPGLALPGLPWPDLAWPGSVCPGLAWPGLARPDPACGASEPPQIRVGGGDGTPPA